LIDRLLAVLNSRLAVQLWQAWFGGYVAYVVELFFGLGWKGAGLLFSFFKL